MDLIRNRIPEYPGRVKLTPVSGQTNVYDLERADNPREAGTKVNAYVLNAIYGFDNRDTVFQSDGSIESTDPNTGGQIVTEFLEDGSIRETISNSAGNSLVKTTTFNSDGSISEVLEY